MSPLQRGKWVLLSESEQLLADGANKQILARSALLAVWLTSAFTSSQLHRVANNS